jgi:hypothetical protein
MVKNKFACHLQNIDPMESHANSPSGPSRAKRASCFACMRKALSSLDAGTWVNRVASASLLLQLPCRTLDHIYDGNDKRRNTQQAPGPMSQSNLYVNRVSCRYLASSNINSKRTHTEELPCSAKRAHV